MLLHRHGPARQGQGLLVGEHEAGALLRGDTLVSGLAVLVVDHAQGLVSQLAPDQRRLALFEQGLEDVVFVRVHRPLYHVLPETVGGVDEHHVLEAGLGVDGEHHPRRAAVGVDHLLHAHGQGHVEVVEAPLGPVGDGPVGEQGGEALVHRPQQVVLAAHVKVGLLLAGEARLGQVLGGGRGAHRHRHLALQAPAQLPVPGADIALNGGGDGSVEDPSPGPLPGVGQIGSVAHVQVGEQVGQRLAQAALVEQGPVGPGGHREPTGNPDPRLGQAAGDLSEGGVLSAHLGNHVHGEVVEPDHVGDIGHGFSFGRPRYARRRGGHSAILVGICRAAGTGPGTPAASSVTRNATPEKGTGETAP